MIYHIIGSLLFLCMGLSLGILGSGGAIIAVPSLVYFFHIGPLLATTYSLGLVGITSLMGAYLKGKKGEWDLKKAWPIGLSSTVGLLIARSYLLPHTPEIINIDFGYFQIGGKKSEVIMFFFATMLILVGRKMLRTALFKDANTVAMQVEKNLKHHISIMLGLLVGILAGFMGAGGGFFFIPILSLGLGMSMHKAAGTSLLIIGLNSLTGFMIDIFWTKVHFEYLQFLLILCVAIAGMLIGLRIASQLNEKKLKIIFSSFLLILGLAMMLDRFFLPHV